MVGAQGTSRRSQSPPTSSENLEGIATSGGPETTGNTHPLEPGTRSGIRASGTHLVSPVTEARTMGSVPLRNRSKPPTAVHSIPRSGLLRRRGNREDTDDEITPAPITVAQETAVPQGDTTSSDALVGHVVRGKAPTSELHRQQLMSQINNLKTELQKEKGANITASLALNFAHQQIKTLESKLQEKDTVIDSLRGVINATKQTKGRVHDPGQSGRRKYDIQVKEVFKGVALGVYHNMIDIAKREISEFLFDKKEMKRNWNNRCELLLDERHEEGLVLVAENKPAVPKSPDVLLSSLLVYTPSFTNGADGLLRKAAEEEIRLPMWNALKESGQAEECVANVCQDLCLKQRMRQTLSDVAGVRKRNAREKLFFLLGYDALWKRIKETAENAEEIQKQITEAQNKLLKIDGDGEPDTSWWRRGAVEDLKYSKHTFQPEISTLNSADACFSNSVGLAVLQQFRGYTELTEDGNMVEGSLLLLVRLDAWIWTVVKLLTPKTTRGGQRQRLFSKLFGEMLPMCYNRLAKEAYTIVKQIHNEDFLNFGKNDEDWSGVEGNVVRQATVAFQMPSNKQFYLVVRNDFFSQHMTKKLGIVHDCFIGSCSEHESEFKEFGVVFVNTESAVGDTTTI